MGNTPINFVFQNLHILTYHFGRLIFSNRCAFRSSTNKFTYAKCRNYIFTRGGLSYRHSVGRI
ncbi:hypothetical protein PMAYCL1PPCAC_03873 [Pristionchus mayeri]|uniref:Uncharacterized protein n=1 Tax=Pristionchus mayeri TaxID=1317129 RepID=A0AAN5C1T0_9BILA|nr:hypothetical protein PMAYCL1PPCAC_03873 [Pristionchus mayeri]